MFGCSLLIYCYSNESWRLVTWGMIGSAVVCVLADLLTNFLRVFKQDPMWKLDKEAHSPFLLCVCSFSEEFITNNTQMKQSLWKGVLVFFLILLYNTSWSQLLLLPVPHLHLPSPTDPLTVPPLNSPVEKSRLPRESTKHSIIYKNSSNWAPTLTSRLGGAIQ